MNSPVFIIACDRSGTTLLRLMLNQSPTLYIGPETGFLDRLRKRQKVYGDFAKPYQRYFFLRDLQTNKASSRKYSFSAFDLSVEEAEAAIAKVSPTNYAGAAAALFQACADKHGKSCWGDKTPRYIFDLDWLVNAYPTAKFIHLIRDGRDVAASIIRAGWMNNFVKAAHYWQERVAVARGAGEKIGSERYCELRYEQLITEPEKTLKDLCIWLDIAYTDAMLKHHESEAAQKTGKQGQDSLHRLVAKPVDASRAYAWKQELSRGQVADFESVAGDLLRQLAYEVIGAKVLLPLQASRAMTQAIKSYLHKKAPMTARRLGIN